MVPLCSDRISRVPLYSSLLTIDAVSHTGLSPAMAGLSRPFCYDIDRYSNRAGPRSLATTSGISVDFSSYGYLDVSVPRVRFACLCIQHAILPKQWVSPFGNPRIEARLPAPRGLSQATTSFIASYRLGIHHVRLFA